MTGKSVQVFEYGYVCHSQLTTIPSGVVAVSKHAYQYLKRLSLSDSTESKSLRLKSVGAIEAIQFLNYVFIRIGFVRSVFLWVIRTDSTWKDVGRELDVTPNNDSKRASIYPF